jgi:hypothetical protein
MTRFLALRSVPPILPTLIAAMRFLSGGRADRAGQSPTSGLRIVPSTARIKAVTAPLRPRQRAPVRGGQWLTSASSSGGRWEGQSSRLSASLIAPSRNCLRDRLKRSRRAR